MLSDLDGEFFAGAYERLKSAGKSFGEQCQNIERTRFMVKLFLPDKVAKWIIVYADEHNPDLLWGLADLGFDIVEFGIIPLPELRDVRGPLGCRVQVDLFFKPELTFGEIQKNCEMNSRIIY